MFGFGLSFGYKDTTKTDIWIKKRQTAKRSVFINVSRGLLLEEEPCAEKHLPGVCHTLVGGNLRCGEGVLAAIVSEDSL